ncbi:MAG: DUF2158 domain-containing protein [Porphyrobacter sp.]|nr:DUF2158 domain-containing protein [Porphyrobacter sp.]
MSETFGVGSTVQLRSGGREMTAMALDDTTVRWVWMSTDGRLREHDFPHSVSSSGAPIHGVTVVEQITCGSPAACPYRGAHGHA